MKSPELRCPLLRRSSPGYVCLDPPWRCGRSWSVVVSIYPHSDRMDGSKGWGPYHVNMPLLLQHPNLRLGQTRETEHANLIRNVVPSARRALLLQALPQALAHLRNATTHRLQILLPLLEQSLIIQHPASDTRAIRRRVTDLTALQNSQLRRDMRISLAGLRTGCGNEMECARALAIQTKVLSEGLGHAQLEALLDEVAHGPGVANEITRGETLVGAVKEGEMVALAHDDGDVLPLGLGQIDTGGVVGADVQEDDGAGGSIAQGGEHAGEVEAFGLRVEVGVVGEGEVDVGEDLVVVGPGWVGEVDGGFRVGGVEFGEEESAQVHGTGAGDGLEGAYLGDVRPVEFKRWKGMAYAVLANGRAISANDQFLGGSGVVGETFDGEVFVIEGGVIANELVSLSEFS